MKKLGLWVIAIVGLIGTPALAADINKPVYKVPPPPPVPVYTWTGWYVGGNVGYSWGSAHTDIAGNATTITDPLALGLAGGFPGNNIAFADSDTARLNGVIGGGQIGYNYQFSPTWVLGFETDFQGSGERGSNALADPFSSTVCAFAFRPVGGPTECFSTGPLNLTAATSYDAKIDWFGTVRARLGYLIADQVLLYGTGGLAYGRVELSGATNISGSFAAGGGVGTVPVTPGVNAFSQSATNVGWTVGAGIEGRFGYRLPAGWTWKLEYLYVDLGSVDTTASFPGGPTLSNVISGGQVLSPFNGTITTHTHFTDNVVRLGLNYKFTN
jgi:outer membrane immunogenic protein